jgi:V8-like Glu-specific endopeptidase
MDEGERHTMESADDLHTPVSNEEPEEPESAQFDDELTDIGEASFGPADTGLEAIIGGDDRKQIADTKVFPNRAARRGSSVRARSPRPATACSSRTAACPAAMAL